MNEEDVRAARTGTTGRGRRHAFTLIELLVVITVILILGGMLLPSLSRARQKASRVACLNNQKQLGMGFMMYARDNRDILPADASRAGHHPEDWIWWQPGRPFTLTQSPILTVMNGSTLLLRCPLDKDDSGRNAIVQAGGDFYSASYTINGFADATGIKGAASSWSAVDGRFLAQKMGRILTPSVKILLAEESSFAEAMEDRSAFAAPSPRLDDGQWMPPGDTITSRHNGKGNANFADGHAEVVDRSFASDPNHYDSTL